MMDEPSTFAGTGRLSPVIGPEDESTVFGSPAQVLAPAGDEGPEVSLPDFPAGFFALPSQPVSTSEKPARGGPLLPASFSLAQLKMPRSIRDEKGTVGLLCRLSVDRICRVWIETVVKRNLTNRSPEVNRLFDGIFGTRQDANALDSPGYDHMGAFPAFVDTFERQYFIGLTASRDAGEQSVSWHVRLPKTSGYVGPRSPHFVGLPRPGEKLELRACGLPVMPFYYDPVACDVRSISENSKLNSARYGYTTMLWESVIHEHILHTKVLRTEAEREASCMVHLDVYEPSAVLLSVETMRSAYSHAVSELFEGLLAERTDARTAYAFVNYLNHVWVPKAAEALKRQTRTTR